MERTKPTTAWMRLVQAAATIDAAVAFAVGLAQREQEALAIGVGFVAGLILLRVRGGLAGRIVLGLSFANAAAWMLTAAGSGVQHHDSLLAVLISVVLAVSSLVGLIGLAGRLVPGAPAGAPGAIAVAAVVVIVLALAGAGVRPGHAVAAARPGDLTLSARDTRYSTNHLVAQGQEVSVRMTNHDLFWHTFTVKGLGVDLKVPVDGTRRITFHAPPGVYEFYCRVPGHKQAGMHGTIVIP